MDGFDDLLAPSRSILEQNPFEDPFAKPRSGSPDPWSSFGQQQESLPSHSDIDYFRSGFEDQPSTIQTTESYSTGDYGHSEPSSAPAPADPLDAAAVSAEDHEDGQSASHSDPHSDTTTSRTPGFGIFTSNSEGTQSTAPDSESSHHDTEPSVSPMDEAAPSATSILRTEESSPPQVLSPPELASSTRTSPERAIVSPLDQHSPPSNIDRAFSSLALGGESYGGWQTGWGSHDNVAALSTPASTTNNDDDDDDDTPIGQTARFRNAGSQASVPRTQSW